MVRSRHIEEQNLQEPPAVGRPAGGAREPLYHAVALGMTAYSRLAFSVEVLARERIRVSRGSLLVSTHRAETDVPILIPAVYWHGDVWCDRTQRLSFAAREDLFEPGFFAGFPPALPPPMRRLFYPIAIARYLPLVRVYPIRSARTLRIGQGLRLLDPTTPLDDVLAPELVTALRDRAPEIRSAGDALRGELADVLWRPVAPDELRAPEAWSRWATEAKEDVRRLVALVRTGEPLLLFPEGRPSPDGAVGPLRRGLELLVRRGRPAVIRPLALVYDPFVRGRPKAVLSFGRPFAPPGRDVDATVLRALRLAMPVTTASVVAHALRAGEDPSAALDRAVAEAPREGRNVERALLSPSGRRARLRECLAALELDDSRVERLAREYESARES